MTYLTIKMPKNAQRECYLWWDHSCLFKRKKLLYWLVSCNLTASLKWYRNPLKKLFYASIWAASMHFESPLLRNGHIHSKMKQMRSVSYPYECNRRRATSAIIARLECLHYFFWGRGEGYRRLCVNQLPKTLIRSFWSSYRSVPDSLPWSLNRPWTLISSD